MVYQDGRGVLELAALVFDGTSCVGWCQFGAPDEVPRIKSRAAYEKGRSSSPDWRIACNFVGKGHRRQGVATAALAGALCHRVRAGGGDGGVRPSMHIRAGARAAPRAGGFCRGVARDELADVP